MAISLYDLSVPSYLQILGAVAGFLERGRTHFTEQGTEFGEIVETRLFPDMMPLRFQVQSVAHHSLGAIEGVKKGEFRPPSNLIALDYAGLQTLVADTRQALERLDRAEIDALEDRDVVFHIRDRQVPFTAEGFLLSFSLPNFYFHAATAYDILRMKGVPLGKRDFIGQMRIKQ